ncbi:MAG TPA: DinB family protein [Candidatus Sulfotelmatobacter sp.]|nr:DinB family protein [Candidatus Sulfotelmatobacter sp.]
MMTSAEREFVVRRFAETRERLLRTVHGLSREQMVYRPEPGAWSVAENIEHITAVENFILGLIQKSLQEPAEDSKRSSMTDADVLHMVGTVVRRVQAPERALPRNRWPVEELAAVFESTRERTSEFAATTAGDLRRHFIPHFIFGELDCYQWLLLLGAHTDRHCAQSDEVKACPRFPK